MIFICMTMAKAEPARVLGIDYGDRAIGLAVSDELGMYARGLTTVRRGKDSPKWAYLEEIKEIAEANGVKTIVLGLPKNMNNTIGSQAEKTLEFGEKLKEILTGVNLVFKDERLTTALAERMLSEREFSRKRRSMVVDKIAAEIILQDYLDERQRIKKLESEVSL